MRWFLPIIFLSLARPAFAQENEAEKLFRAMEMKISEAKSLMVTITHGSVLEKGSAWVKASLIVGEKNASRWEIEGFDGKESVRNCAICDEKVALSELDVFKGWRTQPVSATRNQFLLAAFTRTGICMLGAMHNHLGFEDIQGILVDEFKLGGTEQVLGTSCQIVQYRLRLDPNAPVVPAKVWIETKTSLPKRLQLATEDGPYVETYAELVLDTQLDPKEFELPK